MKVVKLVLRASNKRGKLPIEFVVLPKHYMGCNSCNLSLGENICTINRAKLCGKAVYKISKLLNEDIDVCPKIYYIGKE